MLYNFEMIPREPSTEPPDGSEYEEQELEPVEIDEELQAAFEEFLETGVWPHATEQQG